MIGRVLFIFVILAVSHESTGRPRKEDLRIFVISLAPQKHLLRTKPDIPNVNITYVDAYDHARQERHKLIEKERLESQQKKKREELLAFFKTHYISTNYFYNEMKRIMKTGVLKDPLRQMLEYLEKPENANVKTKVLKCFYRKKALQKPQLDPYAYRLNNLVINVMKDPYNDGIH